MLSKIKPLDHYYLKLRNGFLAVVSGNWHTDYCIIGYIKYKPCSGPTQWADSNVFYERLVKTYSASEVRKHVAEFVYVPFFDSSVPCIPLGQVVNIFNPVERAQELISHVSDSLEKTAEELVLDVVSNTGVLVGITGSMLPKIHNPDYSDMDFVVYGSKSSLEVVEYISSNQYTYRPLSDGKLKIWAERAAVSTGLVPRDALRFYRNWRRGVYSGREYSFTYNDGIYRDVLLMPAFKTVGAVRAVVDVYGDIDALNYPSLAHVLSYRILGSRAKIPYDVTYILSYDALYTAALYEGGVFEVNGLLQCSEHIGLCRVVLGVHEYRGLMRYLD